jgi:hypothetical protein
MTHSRTWLVSAAVFALLFGIDLPDPKLTGEHFPLPSTKRGSPPLMRDWMRMSPRSVGARRNARAAPLLISRPLD